jgi:hypothetical protein
MVTNSNIFQTVFELVLRTIIAIEYHIQQLVTVTQTARESTAYSREYREFTLLQFPASTKDQLL